MPPTLTLTITSDGLSVIKDPAPPKPFRVGKPGNKVEITVVNEDADNTHQIRLEKFVYEGDGTPFDPLAGQQKTWILFPGPDSKTAQFVVKPDAAKEKKVDSHYHYVVVLDSSELMDPEIVVDPASLVSSSEMMMRRAPARKQAKKKLAGAKKKGASKRKTAAKKKGAPKRGGKKTAKRRATRKKR